MRAPKTPQNPCATDPNYSLACARFKLGATNRAVRDVLNIGDAKVRRYREQFNKDQADAELEQMGATEI